MACQFSTDTINTVAGSSILFSKDGSDLCVRIVMFDTTPDERSYPLTDTDLEIATDIAAYVKSEMSADQLAVIRRAFNIRDLVLHALRGE